MEREERHQLETMLRSEVTGLSTRLRASEEQAEQGSRRLGVMEAERVQLLREAEVAREEVAGLGGRAGLQEELRACREREEKVGECHCNIYIPLQLVAEVDSLKRPSPCFPLAKSSSHGGSLRNLPADPRDQAVYFYRKLLRAESYRKALVWQKR